jgi:ABC-type glycerol-3-phosphate transport system substrate-binding protein
LRGTGTLKSSIAFVVLFVMLAMPSSAIEGPVTVMILATFVAASWEQALELFTEKNGIEVEGVVVAGWNAMRQRLPVMVAGGVAPDAVYHDGGAQGDLVANGSVVP